MTRTLLAGKLLKLQISPELGKMLVKVGKAFPRFFRIMFRTNDSIFTVDYLSVFFIPPLGQFAQ
jgi:hypothetical protein